MKLLEDTSQINKNGSITNNLLN